VVVWRIPRFGHRLLKAGQPGPEVLKLEHSCTTWSLIICQEQGAVIRVSGGKRVEFVAFESQVPILVAEKAVKANQRRAASLIAPGEPPVL
jgi:hypothetical protein